MQYIINTMNSIHAIYYTYNIYYTYIIHSMNVYIIILCIHL